MKAKKVKTNIPSSGYRPHVQRMLVYVGNVNPEHVSFFSAGAIQKQTDIVTKNRGIQPGHAVGDIFVKYTTGEYKKIGYTKANIPRMLDCTDQDIKSVSHHIETVERQLKWRKNSYCESKLRRKHRQTSQYTLTSNAEAERRLKYAETNRERYYKNKQRRLDNE
jgi:hypothetical protein